MYFLCNAISRDVAALCPKLESDTAESVFQANKPARMVRLLALFLWLSLEECQRATARCPSTRSFTVPHEWYQPGTLLIGGMTSQIFYVFNKIAFRNYPPQVIGFDLPL